MADMTYSDSAASIRNNQWFRSRVDVATSKYSNYLLNTPDTDAEHANKWAAGKYIATNSGTIVESLMFTLAGDSEVLAAGPAIPDVQLQSIVEKTISKLYSANAMAPVGYAPVMPQHRLPVSSKPQ
jgi:hypothetical protein